MEEHKTRIAEEVMRIVKKRSPDCCDFVFDKIRSFVDELQANPQMAPQGQPNVHLRLLFAAGQGFLCGYEAALNGRYDQTYIDVSSFVRNEPWWHQIEHSLEDREPPMSLPERMFLLARTSLFSQGMMKKRNPDAILYYAGYGFAIGLERGISDLSAKEVVYPADDAAELGKFKQRLRQEARRAVGEAVLADSLRIRAVLGCLDHDRTDEFDVEWDSLACDDQGWEDYTLACGDVGDFMRALAEAAEGYIWGAVPNRSRKQQPDNEAIRASLIPYVAHYIDGWCEQAFGCVPDHGTILRLALDFGGLRGQFATIDGADYAIDLAVASGQLSQYDIDLAKASARHMQDCLLREKTECSSTDMMRHPWAAERLDIPKPTDPVWAISAIAYAHGVKKAVDEGRKLSEPARDAFVAAAELAK